MDSLAASILRRYLAAFVEGFKPEQLTLSLLRGAGEIKDIYFNAKAINEFIQLPTLQVAEAHVERLAVRVSLRKIGTRPIVLTFEKVTIDLEEPVYLPDYPPPPETPSARYGLADRVVDGMTFEFKDVVLRWRTLGRLKCAAPGPWQPPALMLRVDSIRAVNADRRWLAAPLSSIVEESRGQAVVTVRKLWAFDRVEALVCPPEARSAPIGRAVRAATPLLAPTSLELRMTLRKDRVGLASRGFAMEFSTPRLAFCALERAALRAATPCLVAVYFALCRTPETEGMAIPQWQAAGKGGGDETDTGQGRDDVDGDSADGSDGEEGSRPGGTPSSRAASSPSGPGVAASFASPPGPGGDPLGGSVADGGLTAQGSEEGASPAAKPRRTSLFARLLRRKRRPSGQADPQAGGPGSGSAGGNVRGPPARAEGGAGGEEEERRSVPSPADGGERRTAAGHLEVGGVRRDGGFEAGPMEGAEAEAETKAVAEVEAEAARAAARAAEAPVPGMGVDMGLEHPDFVITLATDLVTVALPTESAGPGGSGLAVLSAETLLIDYLWPSHLPAYETVTQIRVRRLGAHFAAGATPPGDSVRRASPTSAPLVELMEGEKGAAVAPRGAFPARFDAPDWVQDAGMAPHGPDGGSDGSGGGGGGAHRARDGAWHVDYFSLARYQPPQRVPEQEVEVRLLPTRVHAAPAAWRAVTAALGRDWRPEWVSGLWDGVALVDAQAEGVAAQPQQPHGAGKGGGEEAAAAEARDEVHEEGDDAAAAAGSGQPAGAAGAVGGRAESEGSGGAEERGETPSGAVQLLAEYNGTWILRLLADAVVVAVPPSAGSPPYELRVADVWAERLPWERGAQLSGDARAKFPLWWLPPAREDAGRSSHGSTPPPAPRGRPGVAVSAIHGAIWSLGVPSLDLVCAGGDRRLLSAAGRAVLAVDERGSPAHVSAALRRAALVASPAVVDSVAAAAAANMRAWRRVAEPRAGGGGSAGVGEAGRQPVWRSVGWDVALGRASVALPRRAADPTPDLGDPAALVLRATDAAAGLHHAPRPRWRQSTRRRARRGTRHPGMPHGEEGLAPWSTAQGAPRAPGGGETGLGMSRALFAAAVRVGSWELAATPAQGGKEHILVAVTPPAGSSWVRTAWASTVHTGLHCGSVPPSLVATVLGRQIGDALAAEVAEIPQRRRASSACSEDGDGENCGGSGGGGGLEEGAGGVVEHGPFLPVHPPAWRGRPPTAAVQRVAVDAEGEVVADAALALRQAWDAVAWAAAQFRAAQAEDGDRAARRPGADAAHARLRLGFADPLLAGCGLTVNEVDLRLPHRGGGGEGGPVPALHVGFHGVTCALRVAHHVGPGLDAFLRPAFASAQRDAGGGPQGPAVGREHRPMSLPVAQALRSSGRNRRKTPLPVPHLWLQRRVSAELQASLTLPGVDGLVGLAAQPGVEQTLEAPAAGVAAAIGALQWRGEPVSAVTRKPYWAAALWEALLAAWHVEGGSVGAARRRPSGHLRSEGRMGQGPVVTLQRGVRTAAVYRAAADVAESLRFMAESVGEAWEGGGHASGAGVNGSPRSLPPAPIPGQAEEVVHEARAAAAAASVCTEAALVPVLRSAAAAAASSEGSLQRVEALAQDVEATARHIEAAAVGRAVAGRKEGADALRLAAGVLSRALPRHQGWVWHTALGRGEGGGGGDGSAGDGVGGGEGRETKSLARRWACLGKAGVALFDVPTDRLPRTVVALEASQLVEDVGVLRAPGVGAMLPAFALRLEGAVHTVACASVEDRVAWVSAIRGHGSPGEEEGEGERPGPGARPVKLSVGTGAGAGLDGPGLHRPPRPSSRSSRRLRELAEGGTATPTSPAATASPSSAGRDATTARVSDEVGREGAAAEARSQAAGAESESETEADSVSTLSRSSAATPRGEAMALLSQPEERLPAQGAVWLHVCGAEVVGTVKRPALRFATEVRDEATTGAAGPWRTVWHSLRQWTALRANAERLSAGLAASQAAGAFSDAKRLFAGLSSAHRAMQCRALDAWAQEAGVRARADPALRSALQHFLDEGVEAVPGPQRQGNEPHARDRWVQEDASALLAKAEALETSPATGPLPPGDAMGAAAVNLIHAVRGARVEAQRIHGLVEQAARLCGYAGGRAQRGLALHARALRAAERELQEGRLRQLDAEARAREASAAEADVRRELRWWTERDPATAVSRDGRWQHGAAVPALAVGSRSAGVDGKQEGAPDLQTPARRGRTLSEPTGEKVAPAARGGEPPGPEGGAEASVAEGAVTWAEDNDAMMEEARQAAEAARAAMRGSRGSQAEMAALAREQAAAASKRRSREGAGASRRRGSTVPHRPRARSAVWPGTESAPRPANSGAILEPVVGGAEAKEGAAATPPPPALGSERGPAPAYSGPAHADRREEHLQRLAQRLMRELASAEDSVRQHDEALSRKDAEIGSLRRRLRSASVAWEHERRVARAETENAGRAADEASGRARAMEREVEVARSEAAALRERVEALEDALHFAGSHASKAPAADE